MTSIQSLPVPDSTANSSANLRAEKPNGAHDKPENKNKAGDLIASARQSSDKVDLSPAAQKVLAAADQQKRIDEKPAKLEPAKQEPKEASNDKPNLEISEKEQASVEKLKARDQEVRRHESAHAAAGGQYAGNPSFGYETGPDGKQYATSGEVSIDVSPISGDPEATISKMQTVRAAALAPAEPSGQDHRVAAQAQAISQQAQSEAQTQKTDGPEEQGTGGDQQKFIIDPSGGVYSSGNSNASPPASIISLYT